MPKFFIVSVPGAEISLFSFSVLTLKAFKINWLEMLLLQLIIIQIWLTAICLENWMISLLLAYNVLIIMPLCGFLSVNSSGVSFCEIRNGKKRNLDKI